MIIKKLILCIIHTDNVLKCSYNEWKWYRAKNVQIICPFSVGGGIHMPVLDKINWNRQLLQCCTRHHSLSIPGRLSNHHHPDMKKHYNWRKPQPLVSNALQYNKHAEYTHGTNDYGSKITMRYFKRFGYQTAHYLLFFALPQLSG